MIGVETNQKSVIARIVEFNRKVPVATSFSMQDVAYELLRLSQFEVPHDEGTLQNSGTVEPLANGDIVLGYHEPYAARLHEHPEYHFQKGRKGKYLEDPINHNAAILGLQFGKSWQTRMF